MQPKKQPKISSSYLVSHLHQICTLSSMAMLQSLPEEIVTQIATHFGTSDISNLRLACRDLRDKSIYYFAKAFFNRVKFRFDRKGLNSLLCLAQHSEFSKSVREIHIELERWNPIILHCKIWIIGWKEGWQALRPDSPHVAVAGLPDFDRPEVVQEYCRCFDTDVGERFDIVNKGYDQDVLQQTIALLPHLHKVVLSEVGQGGCWQVCGSNSMPCGGDLSRIWSLLGEEMGGLHGLQTLERHHLFSMLMTALLHNNKNTLPKLRSLDMCISDYEYANPPLHLSPKLLPNLQSLSLTFCGTNPESRQERFSNVPSTGSGPTWADLQDLSNRMVMKGTWLVDLAASCKRLARSC